MTIVYIYIHQKYFTFSLAGCILFEAVLSSLWYIEETSSSLDVSVSIKRKMNDQDMNEQTISHHQFGKLKIPEIGVLVVDKAAANQ